MVQGNLKYDQKMTARGRIKRQRAIKRHCTLPFLPTPTAQRHPGLANGAYASVSHLQDFFLHSFLHFRSFGLVRRQARAAADLCVAFFRALHSDHRLSHPVFARVVLAESLADLFGKLLVRVASRDRC